MKAKLLCTLTFLSIFLTASFGQRINEPYEFPMKPGTKEWNNLKSRQEREKACQVPENILQSLTTEALVKTCLNYPFFKDLYFFNDIQAGFNTIVKNFNGFQELLSRENAGRELLEVYQKMIPSDYNQDWNDNQRGDFAFNFASIELLLAQPSIISSLDNETLLQLNKEAIKKYEQKKNFQEVFTTFSLSPSVLIIARILDLKQKIETLSDDTTAQAINLYLDTGVILDIHLLEKIYVYAKSN